MDNSKIILIEKINPNNLHSEEEKKVVLGIRHLLGISKDEFIPPLDYRTGIRGRDPVQGFEQVGIDLYYNKLLSQNNICVLSPSGEVVAFMSFRHDFEDKYYFSQIAFVDDVINYVTTLIVHPGYKRQGLATLLYQTVENCLTSTVKGTCIATRTWHTNYGHIKLLQSRGYNLTCTFHSEREWPHGGKKYDTVYFCKRLSINE
jgi:ribosomal protein S18 acetylase RimI-like enzyme